VSLADTAALLNLISRIITRKVHIEKIFYRGEFSGDYWKYDICSVFFANRDNFFVQWNPEGWPDDSTLHNP
jgi:hypothetical protein